MFESMKLQRWFWTSIYLIPGIGFGASESGAEFGENNLPGVYVSGLGMSSDDLNW